MSHHVFDNIGVVTICEEINLFLNLLEVLFVLLSERNDLDSHYLPTALVQRLIYNAIGTLSWKLQSMLETGAIMLRQLGQKV
jgi:hypothetical protein